MMGPPRSWTLSRKRNRWGGQLESNPGNPVKDLEVHIQVRLLTHPKLMAAAARLRGNVANPFTLYVAGIAYSREHLTNGFIPDQWVKSTALVRKPETVASALSVSGLWNREDGGYRIHDYLNHNRNAQDVKDIREAWRLKKAEQRAARPRGTFAGHTRGHSGGQG